MTVDVQKRTQGCLNDACNRDNEQLEDRRETRWNLPYQERTHSLLSYDVPIPMLKVDFNHLKIHVGSLMARHTSGLSQPNNSELGSAISRSAVESYPTFGKI